MGFDEKTTTDEVLEGIDLSSKTVLVTGGTSGIGAETVRALAAKKATVILTTRDKSKGDELAKKIRSSTGNEGVTAEQLDLSSLASIRKFCEGFCAQHKKLDILINNAGVYLCPLSHTADGFELQFGTNHLGHFLLTGLLSKLLIAGAPARIVNVSSDAHVLSSVDFEDVNYKKREYERFQAYAQSKTANILHAVELERRLSKHNVHAYAVHPGVIRTEGLLSHLDKDYMEGVLGSLESGEQKEKSVGAGAATSVFAATAKELEGKGGVYLRDCALCPVNDDAASFSGVRSFALDGETAKKLWEVSETMVGEKFGEK